MDILWATLSTASEGLSVSPAIDRVEGFEFYFYSQDVIADEPPPVHVSRSNRRSGRDAKIWLGDRGAPVRVARPSGFNASELRRIVRIVEERKEYFLEAWHEFQSRI